MKRIWANLYFQILFSVIIISLMIVFFAYRIFVLRPSESDPQIHFAVPQMDTYRFLNNNQLMVGLQIIDFEVFDVGKGVYFVTGVLSFVYDPRKISLDEVSNFEIEHGKIISQKLLYTRNIKDKVFVSYQFEADLKQDFNYVDFPLEDHAFYITFCFKKFSFQDIQFSSSVKASYLPDDLSPSGWLPVDLNVHRGYNKNVFLEGDGAIDFSYPVITYEINFLNPGLRNTIVLMIPVYSLFFFSLFSLLYINSSGNALMISMSAFSGLIILRFVIDAGSPHINYSTFLDLTFMYTLVLSFIVFVINTYQTIGSESKHHNTFRYFIFYVSQILMIGLVFNSLVL